MTTRKSLNDELTLTEAVNRSVTAARGEFSQRDMATITLARQYATQIDAALADPEATPGEKVKALHLAPHLLTALKALGMNPEGREDLALVRAKALAAQQKAEPAKSAPAKGSAALKQQALQGLRAV